MQIYSVMKYIQSFSFLSLSLSLQWQIKHIRYKYMYNICYIVSLDNIDSRFSFFGTILLFDINDNKILWFYYDFVLWTVCEYGWEKKKKVYVGGSEKYVWMSDGAKSKFNLYLLHLHSKYFEALYIHLVLLHINITNDTMTMVLLT